MIREIENAQNMKDYKAHRQIQNMLANDTPVKTKDNRQYIDNIPAYDRDVQRITKSIHHKLHLGQNSLPGAQQFTTVTTVNTETLNGENLNPRIDMSYNNGQNNIDKDQMGDYIIYHWMVPTMYLKTMTQNQMCRFS